VRGGYPRTPDALAGNPSALTAPSAPLGATGVALPKKLSNASPSRDLKNSHIERYYGRLP
jgi:hypothetical protein